MIDYVFKHYYSGLCHFAESLIADPQMAKDVVQDFFVVLWEKELVFPTACSLKSYFFTSVKNRCFDVLRHEQVKYKYRKFVVKENNNGHEDGYNSLIEDELKKQINLALLKLPARCRVIFKLNRFEGFTNQEIADKLNLPKRTVENHVSTALNILRIELSGY